MIYKNTLLTKELMRKEVIRIAHDAASKLEGRDLVIVGRTNRGVALGKEIAALVRTLVSCPVPVFDYARMTDGYKGDLDAVVLLVEDVLATGNSAKACVEVIRKSGVKSIHLATLICCGKTKPKVDVHYVGKKTVLEEGDVVKVFVKAVDGADKVELYCI